MLFHIEKVTQSFRRYPSIHLFIISKLLPQLLLLDFIPKFLHISFSSWFISFTKVSFNVFFPLVVYLYVHFLEWFFNTCWEIMLWKYFPKGIIRFWWTKICSYTLSVHFIFVHDNRCVFAFEQISNYIGNSYIFFILYYLK